MIVFLGLAGAGKSVQAQLLSKQLGCEWLGIGTVLRSRADAHRQQQLLEGKLLDDTEIIKVLDEEITRIDGAKNEFVLDGSPRTVRQAKWLQQEIDDGHIRLNGIIHLLAPKEIVRDRLLHRGRPDDKEPAIAERFYEYDHAIAQILEILKSHGHTVHEIDGTGSIEQVHERIRKALGL